MSLNFYHVDAFTTQAFTGNPAGIVILDNDRQFNDDILLQKIGTELNLPATSMLLPIQGSENDPIAKYRIKWFTPVKQIPICGHGTLAASHVIFNQLESGKNLTSIEYDAGTTGTLTAKRGAEDSIILDFPACKLVDIRDTDKSIKPSINLQQVLKNVFADDVEINFIGQGEAGGIYAESLVVEIKENYPLKDAVLDTNALAVLSPEVRGVTFTTRSSKDETSHIHSRVIYTDTRIGEDQVTGSAHCMLAPYWMEKLQLEGELQAAQVSQRGGRMVLTWQKNDMRVLIRSSALTLATGTINLGA